MSATVVKSHVFAWVMAGLSMVLAWAQTGLRMVKKLDRQHGKPLRTLRVKDTLVPIAVVSLYFLSWGFAYGLLDTMNAHVKKQMQLTNRQSSLLAVGYYTTYFITPFLISRPLITHCGYRLTLIVGLLFFVLGSFVTAHAAISISLAWFVGGQFVVGMGVSVLEASANPYAVHCGPEEQSTVRIMFAQGCAAFGTVIAPIVARIVLFGSAGAADTDTVSADAATNLASAVVLYRALGYSVLALATLSAVLFFGTSLVPEVVADHHATSQVAANVDSPSAADDAKLSWWQRVRQHAVWGAGRLWCAVEASWCNIGCQVAVAQNVIPYLEEVAGQNHAQGAMGMMWAQIAFMGGRFAYALGLRWVKPRVLFLVPVVGVVGSSVLAIVLKGDAAEAAMVLIMFFEGPLFPTIFDVAVKGAGSHASLYESIVIMSISGGAILPLVFGVMADTTGVATAFVLVVVVFAMGPGQFAITCNAVSSFKKAIDAHSSGVPHSPDGVARGNDSHGEEGGEKELQELPSSSSRDRASTLVDDSNDGSTPLQTATR